jgi:hypothetical protein
MTTTQTTHVASALTPGFERAMGYAQALLAGVTPEIFARCPEGQGEMNHPAFLYGHLALYPDRALPMMGRPELAQPREGYEELFGPRARNQDDPGGAIYPPMDEIVGYFTERHETLKAALARTGDEVMSSETPDEKMRQTFPTVGSGVSFLIGGHLMMHLGQVSAWRRVMGLGPAMPHVE